MSTQNHKNDCNSNSNSFEQTAIFQITRLSSQISACDEILANVDKLATKKTELHQKEKSLIEKTQEIKNQHTEQLNIKAQALNTAQKTLETAENNAAQLRNAHEKLKTRYEALTIGQLWQEDLDIVIHEIQEKTKPFEEKLSEEKKHTDRIQRQINSLTEDIQSNNVDLEKLNSDLELFNQGQIPEQYLPLIKNARENATNSQDNKIRELTEKCNLLTKECSKLESKIEKLTKKIKTLEDNDNELRLLSSKGAFDRLSSSAWWGSFTGDYMKKAQKISLKKTHHEQELVKHKHQLSLETTLRSKATSNRSKIITAAEVAEKKHQHGLCQSNATLLRQKIKTGEDELDDLKDQLISTQKNIKNIKDSLKQCTAQVAETSRKNLGEQIQKSFEQSILNIKAANDEVANAKNQVTKNTESLTLLKESLTVEKNNSLRELNTLLDKFREAMVTDEKTLLQEVKKLGIEVSPEDIKQSLNEKRFKLIAKLEELQSSLKLNEESYDQENNAANNPINFDQLNTLGQEHVKATGNIYFDFSKNEDDNQDANGRTYLGLRSQITELKRGHGRDFFPESSETDDLLAIFVDTFFPEGITQAYYISNLSVRTDQPYLSIRPQIIGPRLESILPRGRTLAVCGRLWDNQRDVDKPVFLVQRIVEVSHSIGRPFELLISGFVFCQSQNIYPAFKRKENTLSNDFITKLPSISVDTRDRLQHWDAYLDWRERLIHARIVGLRYIKVDIVENGRVRFLTVSESKARFDQIRRTLKNDALYAYSLNYSQDPWQFDYNDRHRDRGAELGDFTGQDENVKKPEGVDLEDLPWDAPFFSHIYFRLPEEAQNKFDNIINSGGTFEEASKRHLNGVHPNGFLALSVIGDISLIRRQRTELQQLQEQSGYAPFLSSYLFDIHAANEPLALKSIPNEQWLQSNLNDDQRLAVQKMISAPDLAMVQGPPGTGKTSMIAEATWQYVHDGKKVLLVSQASLAVNNALERLAQIPAIRAIRLSRRERRNEREHPYSQERAIETYYRSIANTCKSRTLNVWSQADSRVKKLSDWIASFDLVSNDLDSMYSTLSTIKNELSTLKNKLTQLHETDELSRSVEKQKKDMVAFITFMEGCDTFSGSIPDQILNTFYKHVIHILDGLSNSGIRTNDLWHQPTSGSSLERTRYATEALINWRKVIAFKAQILGDIERLEATNEDSALLPDVALRLTELHRKLETTQKAMENDASKASEWQAIQKEIREVKRQGTILDSKKYSSILNIYNDKKFLTLTTPETPRTEVIATLNQIYTLLNKTESELSKNMRIVSDEIKAQLNSITVVSANKEQLRQLEGRKRDLKEQLKEVSSRISFKETRLKEIIEENLQTEESNKLTPKDLYSKAVQELDKLQIQINQNKSFRESWGSLLEQWVNDLTNADTIKCDQDNFLNSYINACNVVGVTCTENKRTLEDAGHNWFDVVIVDEVSKTTPTEILMPLMMARTAILVGDHRQLPPLFIEHEGSWAEAIADQEERSDKDQNSNSELTAENFKRFKRMVTSSLFKEHFENAPNSLKSSLFTQYRMHPQIMRVVNQFYDNRLLCGLSDPDGKLPDSDPRGHRIHGLTLAGEKLQNYIIPERHVAWLDSTLDPHGHPHYERRDLGSSKVNELECVLIAKTLCDIELSCREQGFGLNGKTRKEVGIVTFYGRQVRAIRDTIRRIQCLRNIHFSAIEYDINTVDRYQGQERPIILVSMVRNPPFQLSQRANTAQFERINVAFSRAQELLIVTGAKDIFYKYPVTLPYLDRPGKEKKVEVYRYIIEEIQRNGGLWSSDHIVSQQEYERLITPEFCSGQSNKPKKHNNK